MGVNTELLEVCKELLEEALCDNEHEYSSDRDYMLTHYPEYSSDRDYMLTHYPPYIRAARAIELAEKQIKEN